MEGLGRTYSTEGKEEVRRKEEHGTGRDCRKQGRRKSKREEKMD